MNPNESFVRITVHMIYESSIKKKKKNWQKAPWYKLICAATFAVTLVHTIHNRLGHIVHTSAAHCVHDQLEVSLYQKDLTRFHRSLYLISTVTWLMVSASVSTGQRSSER